MTAFPKNGKIEGTQKSSLTHSIHLTAIAIQLEILEKLRISHVSSRNTHFYESSFITATTFSPTPLNRMTRKAAGAGAAVPLYVSCYYYYTAQRRLGLLLPRSTFLSNANRNELR